MTEIDSPLTFTSYRLPDDTALRSELRRLEATASLPDGMPVGLPVSFGGRLTLLGYEQLQSGSDSPRQSATVKSMSKLVAKNMDRTSSPILRPQL